MRRVRAAPVCSLGFHDEPVSSERLAVPSALYGLSPSQMAAMGLTGESATLLRRTLGGEDEAVRKPPFGLGDPSGD